MTTRQDLETALKQAIRAKDDLHKRTIRMALAAVQLAEVEKRGALDEAGVAAILRKEIKSREETIVDARRAERSDLIAASEAEMGVLQTYLPQAMDPGELERLARLAVAEVGASTPQDLGKVMKVLLPRLEGRASGKAVSDLVRDLLSRS
jgi:uncharacterized protein YqeY